MSRSPHVFTKVVEAALAQLREVGIRILNYLDYWLILAHSRDLLCEHRDLVLRHLSHLGLQVNWEKIKLSPMHSISFLGMELALLTITQLKCLNIHSGENSGSTKTFSEAHGAYGIRSLSNAAQSPAQRRRPPRDLRSLPGPRPLALHCDDMTMSTLRARLDMFDAEAAPPPASAGPRSKKRRSQRPPEPAMACERSLVPSPRASLSPSPLSLKDAQMPAAALTVAASRDEADGDAIDDSCSLLASGSEDWSGSIPDPAPSLQESGGTRASVDAELIRLLTKAVGQLGFEWSPPEEPAPNRLDGCFLPGRRHAPAPRSAPFLPELHNELTKSCSLLHLRDALPSGRRQ
ncbi:hypothetical protein PO909_014527 [Leuciscus waleckii]